MSGPALLAIVSVAIALCPVLPVFLAAIIAHWRHVILTEAHMPKCLIGGHDVGPWLYRLGMCGWFLFFTLPIGFAGLLASGVWALVRHGLSG